MNFNPKIKLSLDAKNKHEAIKELSLILKETGKIDNLENFINEINKREEISFLKIIEKDSKSKYNISNKGFWFKIS